MTDEQDIAHEYGAGGDEAFHLSDKEISQIIEAAREAIRRSVT